MTTPKIQIPLNLTGSINIYPLPDGHWCWEIYGADEEPLLTYARCQSALSAVQDLQAVLYWQVNVPLIYEHLIRGNPKQSTP